MGNAAQLVEKLNAQFDGSLELSEDELSIYALKGNIINLLQSLKQDYNYKMLCDVTSADYGDNFEVIYHVMSIETAEVVRVKVKLPKDAPRIPSAIPVWKAANVQEREIYDLMGIVFEGHDNMVRILCPDDFAGHPLRKDFKLETISRF